MSFLLLWSLRALATIPLGGLLVLGLRRRSAASRCVAFRATLVAVWVLPLAVVFAPTIEVALPEAPTLAPVVAGAPLVGSTPPPSEVPAPTASVGSVVEKPAPARMDPVSVATGLYVLGTLLIASRWYLALVRLRRIVRTAVPIEGGALRVEGLGVPATFGLFRPRILLPKASEGWTEARVRAAILHEEAHVRRRDWAWQALAGLFAAVHWPNPAAWLLLRALRDTAEAAADDEVLAAGLAPSAYARELLEVARTASPAGAAVAMARRGGVKDRVAAILAIGRDRRRPTRATVLLTGAGLLLAGTAVAGLALAQKESIKEEPFVLDPRLALRSRDATGGRIRLADGRRLTLLSLERADAKGHVRWGLDGSLQTPGNEPQGYRNMAAMPDPSFGLRVRVDGKRKEDATYEFRAGYSSEWTISSWEDRRPNGETIRGSFSAPRRGAAASVYVGCASGPWRIARRGASFAPSKTFIDGSGIEVRKPKELDLEQVRLVGYDLKGRKIERFDYGAMHGNGKSLLFASWSGGSPKALGRVDIEYRKQEWVRFADLPVRPGPLPGAPLAVPAVSGIPGPFTLRDGRQVEMTAVHDQVGGRTRSWSPMGTGPARTMEEEWQTAVLGEPAAPGMRRVEFLFSIKGEEVDDPHDRLLPTPGVEMRSGGTASVTAADGTVNDVERWVCEVPAGATRTSVTLQFASGPWTRDPRPVTVLKAEREPFTDTLNGKPIPIVQVTATFPMDLLGRNVRLTAFDRRGKRLPLRRWGNEPGTNNGVREKTVVYGFEAADPRAIARVAFEWRRWEHVRFTGVRLAPDVR